jgi:hypothetical protein
MKYVTIVLMFMLAACGPDQNPAARPFLTCTTSDTAQGALIQCPDGSSSLVTSGANGTPGTVITAVQFCPNVTPVYPSTFPESGICLDGTMYGVYSANGGFLAALPPGQYSSDGINASCTFTIQPNCVIVNQ